MGEIILACDVGGTRLRTALVDGNGSVHRKRAIPTPQDDPSALSRVLRAQLDDSDAAIAAVIVAMPGPISYERGEVLRLPNLRGWEGHISAAGLSAELGMSVLLANDADLAALGEHRFGAGVGTADMVYVTASTGVGAGVVLGNRLLHGALSLAEIGHTVIDRSTRGTVETLGSGTALARLAGEEGASIVARANAGDEDAMRHFAAVAGDFAIGVFNMVHLFSPEVVVIGGGMSQAGDLLLGPVRKMLTRCDPPCPFLETPVVQATGGDDVGLRGAAAYWADYQQAQ